MVTEILVNTGSTDGTKPLPEPMLTNPQWGRGHSSEGNFTLNAQDIYPWHELKINWFNSLWSSDAIWRQRSRSTLAQVMTCCLTAPSHYLNQCWLIIREVQWHSFLDNFTRDTSTINHYDTFENYITKISFNFPRGQWVNMSAASLIGQ